jgi:hypothetical protein
MVVAVINQYLMLSTNQFLVFAIIKQVFGIHVRLSIEANVDIIIIQITTFSLFS